MVGSSLDLIDKTYLELLRDWSYRTFGPGPRTHGILKHIKKEILEIEETPYELEEWVDIAMLALDGALRSGHPPAEIIKALHDKLLENKQRVWPNWREGDQNTPIEHIRGIGDTSVAQAEPEPIRDRGGDSQSVPFAEPGNGLCGCGRLPGWHRFNDHEG